MKRRTSNMFVGAVGLGLFLIIFCSVLVITAGIIGVGYGLQTSAQGTPYTGLNFAANATNTVDFTNIAATAANEVINSTTPDITETEIEQPIETATVSIPSATNTVEITLTETQTPIPPTETNTPTLDATAFASEMVIEIQNLFDSEIISTTDGQFYGLPDYGSSWNQLHVYEQTPTGFYELDDFVLRADASWAVDGNTGDWRESGCGFIFHQDADLNHYMAYYSLDGRARLFRNLNGGSSLLGRTTIYDVDRENGYGKIMIVVEGEYINLYFNEKEIFRKRDPWIASGSLAFTVVSGNMYGYGTQCNLSNIELWEINK
ncbi:MAG: hypothetical protein JEZ00_02445 [Anaerolineaceae bacterium]|nr:hypothetical protein [Anaerolineaceae bacterium]